MKSSKKPELGPTSTIIVNTMAHYQTIGGFAQVALPNSSFKISRNCSLVKQRIRFSVFLWTKVNTPFDLLPLCNHKILEREMEIRLKENDTIIEPLVSKKRTMLTLANGNVISSILSHTVWPGSHIIHWVWMVKWCKCAIDDDDPIKRTTKREERI